MHTASQALAIERQASAQTACVERVSRPKTRAILGLMRLNFLSVPSSIKICPIYSNTYQPLKATMMRWYRSACMRLAGTVVDAQIAERINLFRKMTSYAWPVTIMCRMSMKHPACGGAVERQGVSVQALPQAGLQQPAQTCRRPGPQRASKFSTVATVSHGQTVDRLSSMCAKSTTRRRFGRDSLRKVFRSSTASGV
jgi:hypothetical protein